MFDDLRRDVHYGIRQLRSAPAFTIVATLTLALGVGANTAIFSVVNGLLLRPLPYVEPERLLFVDGVLTRAEGEVRFQVAYPDIEAMRAQSKTLAAVTAWSTAWGLALEGTDGAQRLDANFVGADYFAILGATPLLGRTFVEDDHAIGGASPLVVVLSEPTWRQEFGADPDIVGRSIRLQNRVFTVIGVMPASFTDVAAVQGSRVDVWAPIERAPELFGALNLSDRSSRLMWAVARLAPGASIAAADAELAIIGAQVAAAFPATNTNFSLRAASLAGQYFADARQPLWFLLGGSIFVLLIGCANVANLLLVRASNRSREFAVRQAVGASTGRLVRQVLVESLLLAAVGSAAGLVMASWLTPVLVRMSDIQVPAFARVGIDGTVLGVAVLTSIACGLLFGLAPIWRAARTSVREAMGSTRVAPVSRIAHWVAGVEMTAAFLLAAAALLLLQSFSALTRTDLLFRTDRLLTVRLELPQDRYATPAARARAGEALLERIRAVPGVEQAAIWGPGMFGRSTWIAFLSPTDRVLTDDERLMVWRHSTNPGALNDLEIPVLNGRDFAATDTIDSPPVAILSEAAAARLWPGENAVGKQLRAGAATSPPITVIGVAADARHRGRFRFSLGAAAYEPQLDIYFPYAQRPNGLIVFGVRTAGDPDHHVSAVRAAVAAIDPTLPAYDIESLENRMRGEESPVAFAALLINLYGGVAVLLAAVGVYGVLSAAVAGRSRDIGIRAALGADRRRLLSQVLKEGLMIASIAVAIGGVAASLLSRAFASLLFGVSGGNEALIAGTALLLIALASLASIIPARRAANVDPIAVLRTD
jgi:putative ABC transport system permease protein